MNLIQALKPLTILTAILTIALGRVDAQVCSSTACTSGGNCQGFGNDICTNTTTNLTYTGNVCFVASQCSNYTAIDGDITLTLNGASPRTISSYISTIQSAVMDAYNTFCRSGNNFRTCCPGATDWQNRTNATAMTMASTEVPFLFSFGSASNTTLGIRLRPNDASQLCNATVKATTPAPTTTLPTTAPSTVASAVTTTRASSAAGPAASVNGTVAMTSPAASGVGSANLTATSPSNVAMTSPPAGGTTAVGGGAPMTSPPVGTSSLPASTVAAAAGSAAATSAATVGSMTSPIMSPGTSAMSSPPMATTPFPTNRTGTGRRRRGIPAEERGYEVLDAAAARDAHDSEQILSRGKRDLIALPSTALTNITAAINIVSVVQTVLSSYNITVTVSVSVATVSAAAASDNSTTTMPPAMLNVTTVRKAAAPNVARNSALIQTALWTIICYLQFCIL